MQVRLALVPLVAVLAGAAPVAQAAPKAPKPVCQTIVDAKGDTFAARSQDNTGGPYGPQEDGLDILSADLASDGKVVTAVVRLASLSRAIATSPQGFAVGVDFFIGSGTQAVRLQGVALASGDRFEVSVKDGDALPNTPNTYVGAVTGVVDAKASEVRIHAPAAVLEPYGAVKKGVKLTPNEAESATTTRAVPPLTTTPGAPMTTRGLFADVAVGGKAVAVGARSCVVPGR